ncbi:hypothetical protein PQQ72_15900 [Paraburkholderia strydomiana]|uniref:hypothetical protein n=1 Tax=Paraburkholderia strydomiana TaxID=1245417 RepID=UPI0038B6DFC1
MVTETSCKFRAIKPSCGRQPNYGGHPSMNANCLGANSPGIRTVLHMSPAVMAAAIVSAQKCGLSLREWLDRAVANLIADDHPEGAAPWSVQAADLFANIANCSPELLRGRWALLYELVLLDRDLWHQPEQTAQETDDGELPGAPYIVPARLRKAWPGLVANIFCL